MLSTSRASRAQGAREIRSRNDDESYWSVRRGGVTTSWATTPLRPDPREGLQHICGLRWHGPTQALRAWVPPVVGAPRRSYGYAFVAPPRIWGRGTRNAGRPTHG